MTWRQKIVAGQASLVSRPTRQLGAIVACHARRAPSAGEGSYVYPQTDGSRIRRSPAYVSGNVSTVCAACARLSARKRRCLLTYTRPRSHRRAGLAGARPLEAGSFQLRMLLRLGSSTGVASVTVALRPRCVCLSPSVRGVHMRRTAVRHP